MKLTCSIPGLSALVLLAACQSNPGSGDAQGADDPVRSLEQASRALHELGEHEEAERLEELAARVARERHLEDEHDETEHAEHGEHGSDDGRRAADGARRELLVLRTAVDAFLEIDRHDPADAVEREMHAREMDLAGREDDESRRIRRNRPERGQLIELLAWAADLWDEWGQDIQAMNLRRLAERLHEEDSASTRLPYDARRGADRLENQIEILQLAARSLSMAGDHDAANRLELSIAARRARLEGHEADARSLHERKPSHAEEVELLVRAEDVLRDRDMPDRADRVSAGTERFWGEAPLLESRHEAEAEAARMRVLHEQMLELQARIHALQEQLKRLDETERSHREREERDR